MESCVVLMLMVAERLEEPTGRNAARATGRESERDRRARDMVLLGIEKLVCSCLCTNLCHVARCPRDGWAEKDQTPRRASPHVGIFVLPGRRTGVFVSGMIFLMSGERLVAPGDTYNGGVSTTNRENNLLIAVETLLRCLREGCLMCKLVPENFLVSDN